MTDVGSDPQRAFTEGSEAASTAAQRALPPHLFEPWNTEVYTVFRYEPNAGWWQRLCDRSTLKEAQYEADKESDSGYEVVVTRQAVTHWQRTLVSRTTPGASAETPPSASPAAEAGCDEDPVARWKTEVKALSLPDLIASFGPVAEAGDERG